MPEHLLDNLLDRCRSLSANKYVHADVTFTVYGTAALVIRDKEPVEHEVYGEDGEEFTATVHPGQIITAGAGADLAEAVAAATVALDSIAAAS